MEMTPMTTPTKPLSKYALAMQTLETLLADLTPTAFHNGFRMGGVTVVVDQAKYSTRDEALVVNYNEWVIREHLGAKPRRFTKVDDANLQKIAATIREMLVTAADAHAALDSQRVAEAAYRERKAAARALPLQAVRDVASARPRLGLYEHMLTTEEYGGVGDTTYRHRLTLPRLSLAEVMAALQALAAQSGDGRVDEITLTGMSEAQVLAVLETLRVAKEAQ